MLKERSVIAVLAALVLDCLPLSPIAAQDRGDWYRISDGISRSHVEYHGGKNKIDTRHTILDVKGHGHYLGNFLQVDTKNPGWWGEGITVFHLDGNVMVHTPGTEDEYGSCWGFGGAFSRPCCGYLPDGKGCNRMYRWYLANPVRFQESLKVEIQDICDFGPGADDFTSVAFWYQREKRWGENGEKRCQEPLFWDSL